MAATGSAGVGRKTFYAAGVVDPLRHYVVNRSDWHTMLARKLEDGAFTLLHAHRQGGKSSAARAVGGLLDKRGFRVLLCTMECVQPREASAMWAALESQFRDAIIACPDAWAPPGVADLLRAGEPLFRDAASFQAFFSRSLWGGLRVVLIIDEFDTLLLAPSPVRHELLSSLRSLRTRNSTAVHGSPAALHAVLGIGVYRLLELVRAEDEPLRHSPFNVGDVLSVPSTSLEQVRSMLAGFSAETGHAVPEIVAEDLLWRSGGHVGLLSLLGQRLASLCDGLAPGASVDEASWATEVSGTALVAALRTSPTIASMLRSVSGRLSSAAALEARSLVRSILSAPDGALLDLAGGAASREALDYLMAEGVIVGYMEGGLEKHRLVAPVVAPLLMQDIGSCARVAAMARMPFPRDSAENVRLELTLFELLPFIDLDALYHPYALRANGQPCEFAYHFQLFDLMTHRVAEGGWKVLGETRNSSAPGPLRRLDLLIASNGRRCGIELLVDGAEFEKHVYEQAPTYLNQQSLSSVLVVNFFSSSSSSDCIVERLPRALPRGVQVLHVLVCRAESALTPFKLGDDGLSFKACTKIDLSHSVQVSESADTSSFTALSLKPLPLESLVAPLAGLSVSSIPTAIVHSGVEYGIEPRTTVGDLLVAIGEEIGEPKDSLSMWRVLGDGTERRLANAFTLAAAPPGSRLELRHASGIAPTPLIVECSR
jgi:hypothetical protein